MTQGDVIGYQVDKGQIWYGESLPSVFLDLEYTKTKATGHTIGNFLGQII